MFINKFGDSSELNQHVVTKRTYEALRWNDEDKVYDAENAKIVRIADPVAASDAVNKKYIDECMWENHKEFEKIIEKFESRIKIVERTVTDIEDNLKKIIDTKIVELKNLIDEEKKRNIQRKNELGERIYQYFKNSIETAMRQMDEKLEPLRKSIEDIKLSSTPKKDNRLIQWSPIEKKTKKNELDRE